MSVPITITAWMAGFIDGEGCLTISKQIRKNRPTPQWRPFITIANTNRESLEIFQKEYGGTLRFNKEQRVSKNGTKWSDSWTWYCQQSSVKRLCEDLLPFLIIKKRQAVILIDFTDHIKGTFRPKGGRRKDGTFIGSAQIDDKTIEIRDNFRTEIQSLNSGKRHRVQ